MTISKAWWLGFLLVIAFAFLGEIVAIFGEYTYLRLGVDRNVIIIMLMALPAIASFVVAYSAPKGKALLGLLYIPILSALGPAVHFLIGQFGVPIDLGSSSGLKFTFQIYLIESVVTVGAGTAAALLLRRAGRPKGSTDA